MIDRAGLEIRYTPFGYRGFESLTLRKVQGRCHEASSFFVVGVNRRSLKNIIKGNTLRVLPFIIDID